jgi:hypothetical protein
MAAPSMLGTMRLLSFAAIAPLLFACSKSVLFEPDASPPEHDAAVPIDGGTSGSTDAALPIDGGPSGSTDAGVPLELACDPEEIELAWVDEEAEQTYGGVSLALDPRLGLIARRDRSFGGELRRAQDGLALGRVSPGGALDAAWARTVIVDAGAREAIVRDTSTGARVAVVAASALDEGWFGGLDAQLSADGSRVLLLECLRSPSTEAGRAIVRSVDVADPSSEVRVELEHVCGLEWVWPSRLLPLATRDAVLVAGLRRPGPSFEGGEPAPAPGVALVDLDARIAREVDVGVGEAIEPRGGSLSTAYTGTLLSAALSPDERELAIAGWDGRLHRLDTATLAPIAEPFDVGVAIANPETFLPSVESPIAHAGRWLAHADGEGRIVLRDVASGRTARTFELPFDASAPSFEGDRSAAMAITFTSDGFVVAWSSAMARYACGGRAIEPSAALGDLSVELSGPTRVRVGQRATFSVLVHGAVAPVVRTIVFPLDAPAAASLLPEIEVATWAAGTFEIEARADDGTRSATTRASVIVDP